MRLHINEVCSSVRNGVADTKAFAVWSASWNFELVLVVGILYMSSVIAPSSLESSAAISSSVASAVPLSRADNKVLKPRAR